MSETTYTMLVANDDGTDEIVARNVTAGQALSIAIEHGGAGHARIVCRTGRTHRVYEIVLHPPNRAPELIMAVKLPRSSDEAADACVAADAFERIFLNSPRCFWEGEIVRDEDFARRRAL